MRSIIIILMWLGIYFGICVFAGMGWALLTFALLMITLSTVFVVKKDSYVSYIQFVNPRYAALYNSKDDEFRRKHRITDIIAFYIISSIMLFLTVIMPNVTLTVDGGYLIYLITAVVLITILLWRFSLIILKKSKKNSSFWFYFTALIMFALLVFTAVSNLIY